MPGVSTPISFRAEAVQAAHLKLNFLQRAIPYVLQNIAWVFVASWMCGLFLNLRISGRQHIRSAMKEARERGVGIIFASNHVSEFDPILILLGARPFSRAFPMFFAMASLEHFRDRKRFGWRSYIYGKRFFQCWGSYPILRNQKNYAASLAQHLSILKEGFSLTMFPEGKVSSNGAIGEVHGGIGYLALASEAVVVPVHITGIWNMNPKEFWTRKSRVRVTYGAPLSKGEITKNAEKYQGETQYKKTAAFITEEIRELELDSKNQ